jgi:mannose-1-phosphate guanylyltransferase
MQAMILAAGFGTRLRPYSLLRPKPLFPVLNTPLLSAVVARLKNSGFSKIIVNCHHRGEQIAAALSEVPGVVIQPEEHILGTGGGLRAALGKMDPEPLLVVNGDIYHDMDLAGLYRDHLQAGNGITMVMHDCPRFNSVLVTDGRILDFDSAGQDCALKADQRLMAYTGVQVIDPQLLGAIKKDTASCIIAYYRNLLAQNETIRVRDMSGCCWADMGSPQDYRDLHGALLQNKMVRWTELNCTAQSICVDGRARCPDDLIVEDWACIGRATIGAGVRLRRCVVWDGAEIEPGAFLSDQIVTP